MRHGVSNLVCVRIVAVHRSTDEDAFRVLAAAHAIGMAGNASDVQWIFPDSVASNFHPPPSLGKHTRQISTTT